MLVKSEQRAAHAARVDPKSSQSEENDVIASEFGRKIQR